MLTASHNPIQWNGIKFLTAEGCAPQGDLAEKILGVFKSGEFELVPVEKLGSLSSDDTTHDYHVSVVKGIVDVDKIRSKKFKVVL